MPPPLFQCSIMTIHFPYVIKTLGIDFLVSKIKQQSHLHTNSASWLSNVLSGTVSALEDARERAQHSKLFTAHRVLCSVFNGAASLKTDASTGLANRLVDDVAPGFASRLGVSCNGDVRRERDRHLFFLGGGKSSANHSSIPKLKPGRSQPATDEVSKLEVTTFSIVRPAVSLSAIAYTRSRFRILP